SARSPHAPREPETGVEDLRIREPFRVERQRRNSGVNEVTSRATRKVPAPTARSHRSARLRAWFYILLYDLIDLLCQNSIPLRNQMTLIEQQLGLPGAEYAGHVVQVIVGDGRDQRECFLNRGAVYRLLVLDIDGQQEERVAETIALCQRVDDLHIVAVIFHDLPADA